MVWGLESGIDVPHDIVFGNDIEGSEGASIVKWTKQVLRYTIAMVLLVKDL